MAPSLRITTSECYARTPDSISLINLAQLIPRQVARLGRTIRPCWGLLKNRVNGILSVRCYDLQLCLVFVIICTIRKKGFFSLRLRQSKVKIEIRGEQRFKTSYGVLRWLKPNNTRKINRNLGNTHQLKYFLPFTEPSFFPTVKTKAQLRTKQRDITRKVAGFSWSVLSTITHCRFHRI